jgi:hypothetical protein
MRPKTVPFAPICYHEVSCVEIVFELSEIRISSVDVRLVIITVLLSCSRYITQIPEEYLRCVSKRSLDAVLC